jgi:hypothetical protein
MRRAQEKQLELEYDRGEQLSMRREIKLPPDEKFILWILDDHIGKNAYWPLTVQYIAAESGFSVSKVYKILAALKERTIVHWDRKPATTKGKSRQLGPGERRFFICWPNVEQLPKFAEGCSNDDQNSPLENFTDESDSPLEKTDSPMEKKTVSKFSNGESHIRKNDHSNDLSTPSGTVATVELSDRILRKLKAAGVHRARPAWMKAIANGLSPDDFEAVLDHALAHPGRWPGRVVYSRLTSPDAIDWSPSEGWFGENPHWRPVATTHAAPNLIPTLDNLSESEIRWLMPEELRPQLEAFWRTNRSGNPCRASPFREALQNALAGDGGREIARIRQEAYRPQPQR